MGPAADPKSDYRSGVLLARPNGLVLPSGHQAGFHLVTAHSVQRGTVFVPDTDGRAGELPLAVILHGASGIDGGLVEMTIEYARKTGMIVVVPQSHGTSWDILRGGYGPDVAFVDEMLNWAMTRFPIDPARIGIGGFSDGGSYALSLGLMNGDLFSHILAFSPGFTMHKREVGRPDLFICHGRKDEVLPIEPCGRSLAQRLGASGYAVDYREFDDGHVVPPHMVEVAMSHFIGRGSHTVS